MIETKFTEYEKELNEIIFCFDGAKDLKIKHIFRGEDRRVVNTFILGGKSYSFGNLMPQTKTEIEYKRYFKRFIKLGLYKSLSSFYGVNLPWGALMGIRPTKLAYKSLEEDGEFEDFFINTMKVSESKVNLTERVIKEQKGIYEKKEGNVDFFVFIPFCPSRCKYCSFISEDIKSAKNYVDLYVDTLCREIEESIPLIKNLRSIYIGGGTPFSLSEQNLDKVLTSIDKLNTGVEYTVEAGRPDVITEEKLKILEKHKVNRICINPQTFNDKTLKLIGRNHTENDVYKAYNLAKGRFIINMDLIMGLPGETIEDFKYSVDKAIELNPDNVTVHTLSVKRGSELKKEKDVIKNDNIESFMNMAEDILLKNGYNPYYLYRQKYMTGNLENVGYTKPNKACIYNVDVMEEIADNIACGANAISKRVNFSEEKIERYANSKDVLSYIQKIDQEIDEKKRLFSK